MYLGNAYQGNIMTEQKKFHHGNLREALLQASMELIKSRKAMEFSIREVAGIVGVSHTAAYRHFESKAQIIAAIAVQGFGQLTTQLEEILKNPNFLRPRPLLYAMANEYIDFALNNEGYYRTLFHADVCRYEQFPETMEAAFKSMEPLISSIELAKSKDVIKSHLDTQTIATNIWASLHGYVSLILDCQITEDETLGGALFSKRENFIHSSYAFLFI